MSTATPATEIELLLPWYAAGTLSPAEARRVEEALARDPVLAERLAATREEMDEAIGFAEAVPAPSPRARDRVFDRIAAIEDARRPGLADLGRAASARVQESGFVGRLLELFSGFAPRTLAYAGIAAALVMALQTGIIGSFLVERQGGATYGTASGPGTGPAVGEGTFALVGFAPDATAARIASVLGELGGSIVDGPRPGGLYRVRIASKAVSTEERDRLIARLREAKGVVSMAMPSQ
jgi:hypothetical protein